MALPRLSCLLFAWYFLLSGQQGGMVVVGPFNSKELCEAKERQAVEPATVHAPPTGNEVLIPCWSY